MNRVLILALVIAVAAAGCIDPSPPEDEPENETDTTFDKNVVQQFSLDDTTIFQDGTTYLTMMLQNNRDRPLQDVHAEVGNFGSLQITRQIPNQGQTGISPHECLYPEIPSTDEESAPSRRCIWEVYAGPDMLGQTRDSVRLPLTTFVSYASTLSASRSLSVSFESSRDIGPGDQRSANIQTANTDIRLTAHHASPVPAEDGEAPITVEIRNIGSGDIVGDGSRRSVTITFDGTLADAAWDMQETTCADDPDTRQKTVYFSSGERSTSFSCVIVLQDPDLAGKTFSIRPSVVYEYQVIANAPLTVVRRN